MSLITPDFGLLVWMTLIFGIVFFILAKFGFPAITGMVERRGVRIEESLRKAEEAEKRLSELAAEQERMTEEFKLERSRMLKEASEMREKVVAQAQAQASEEAAKILAHAKMEIEAERASAYRDLCNKVSVISMEVAEKILRKELDKSEEQLALVDRLLKETSEVNIKN